MFRATCDHVSQETYRRAHIRGMLTKRTVGTVKPRFALVLVLFDFWLACFVCF